MLHVQDNAVSRVGFRRPQLQKHFVAGPAIEKDSAQFPRSTRVSGEGRAVSPVDRDDFVADFDASPR